MEKKHIGKLQNETDRMTEPQTIKDNKMIINLNKTKEIVFRRPSIRHLLAPASVSGIKQVMCAKLLGVIFQQNLSFDDQVDVVLRTCSQRVYLLKLLRDQGIPQHSMDRVSMLWCFQNTLRTVRLWWPHHSRSNKKAQLSLTNPRDGKACQNCSNSTCLQRCRWQYWPIFMRLAAVASEIREIPRNLMKIQTYRVQGHPRSSILVLMESPYVTSY